MSNISQRAKFAAELGSTPSGAFSLLGTLLFNPVVIIFDNIGLSTAQISVDGGVTVWKTFPAGEALTLDMRANHGIAANYTFPIGTSFWTNGATADFKISYIYAD